VPSANCNCAAEEKTDDHMLVYCPLYHPPTATFGLTALDDIAPPSKFSGCKILLIYFSISFKKCLNSSLNPVKLYITKGMGEEDYVVRERNNTKFDMGVKLKEKLNMKKKHARLFFYG